MQDSIRNYGSIQVPVTCIKGPGSLFSKENPSSKRALLSEFRTKAKFIAQEDYSTEISNQSFQSTRLLSEAAQSYFSFSKAAEPGRIKKVSEELTKLIQIAQKLMDFYEIELTIDVSKNHLKTLVSALEVLIPEICFFPNELFRKLKIQQLVFSENKSSSSIEQDFKTLDPCFSIDLLNTHAEALRQLYKLICNGIAVTNPRVIKEWNSPNFEEDFISLLKNLNFSLLKKKDEDLKKLLNKYYPEISEEWFQNRNVEKKKTAKVSFNFPN